jgi:hypothetical protein
MQILDERFNEDEYKNIKKIFDDEDKIEKICNIIDEIKTKNINNTMLILGDFLFSLVGKELRDPANIILKTTRNDYIKRIQLRSVINRIMGYNELDYIKLHKKLLVALRKKEIIVKNEIKNKSKDGWETIIYFSLNVNKNRIVTDLWYNNKPFIVADLCNVKYSIGSFRNIWLIKRRKKEMEDIPLCFKEVIKSNQISFCLSSEIYINSEKLIEKEKEKLLGSVGCINTEEYFEKLKEIVKNEKYTYNMIEEKMEEIKINEIFVLKKRYKKEHINIIRIFQKIMSLEILKKDIFDKKIYLPCFMDNRGRQYYGTLISPTFYKIFRYLYKFWDEKKIENLEKSKFYNKIMRYKDEVSEFELREKEIYFMIVLLIEVGKFFIKEEENYIIKTEKIIEYGKKMFKEKNLKIKIDDQIYLKKIYKSIEDLIEKRLDENLIIFKDATASGLQNYGIILGYQEEKLEYLNINGNDWCDGYKYIIKKFVKTENSKILKRKYWKSTIMTIPYNAVWYSCFIKFIKNLREDGIGYDEMKKEDKNKIKETHKEFYKNVKENIKKEFYKEENKKLKMFKYNKWITVNKKEYKINYKKARDKYTSKLYMIEEDEKATERALEANNMHYLDSQLIKKILEKFEIIPIHDCFGIRLSEVHLVIDEINKYYSEHIKKETYCIHIIL